MPLNSSSNGPNAFGGDMAGMQWIFRAYSSRQLTSLHALLTKWSAQQLGSGSDDLIGQHVDGLVRAWRMAGDRNPVRRILTATLIEAINAWISAKPFPDRKWVAFVLDHAYAPDLVRDKDLFEALWTASQRTGLEIELLQHTRSFRRTVPDPTRN